jgi:hypothetical protein
LKDTFAPDPLIDDIAALIDEALAHPARAGLVKAQVRQRLAERSAAPPPRVEDDAAAEDAEDLWDNLPL